LTSKEISNKLSLIAKLLVLNGENQFKVRAFENASRVILQINNLEEIVRKKELSTIKGIGKSLSEVIEEIYLTGESELLNALQEKVSESVVEMLSLKGLGAKKLKELIEKLGIKNIGELEYACNENRLLKLKGFGEKTQKNLLESIRKFKMRKKFLHFPDAENLSKNILDFIYSTKISKKLSVTGKLRRKSEVLDSVEFVVEVQDKDNFIHAIKSLGKIKNISNEKVFLKINEFPIFFYFAENDNFHEILFKTTGSEKFLSAKLINSNISNFSDNEREFFNSVNLPFIIPECREDFIDFSNFAPKKLIHFKSLKGIFHVHTTYSDGVNSLEDIVIFLKEQGYEYVGISDHSKSAFYANGLTENDIKRQHDEIDKLNEKYRPFKIFKGIESDILKNGDLDYPEKVLETFDFIIASVHSSFNLSEKEMTERIVNAVKNPYTTIVGHPTGRLILFRDEYKLNMEKFFETVSEYNKFIEINTHPYRLDFICSRY
jgi:DNA polymerase (family 10)